MRMRKENEKEIRERNETVSDLVRQEGKNILKV